MWFKKKITIIWFNDCNMNFLNNIKKSLQDWITADFKCLCFAASALNASWKIINEEM